MVLVQKKAETIQEGEGQSSSQSWAGQCCSGKDLET